MDCTVEDAGPRRVRITIRVSDGPRPAGSATLTTEAPGRAVAIEADEDDVRQCLEDLLGELPQS